MEELIERELTLTGDSYTQDDKRQIEERLDLLIHELNKKIIVIDDDPTGGQTLHDIMVYTDWSVKTLMEAFSDNRGMFYIMTNSRSLTERETSRVHTEIVANIVKAAKSTDRGYLIISRGDSTLRGHYPLETRVIREELGKLEEYKIDGELIIPFFKEGGRFTIDDIHYLSSGEKLIPVGQSEFADDRTFGYTNSNLKAWIEEKTKGKYRTEDVASVTLPMLRRKDYEGIADLLSAVSSFNKVVVNATCYTDLKVFAIAFLMAQQRGKNFLARTAAAWPKVLGGIKDDVILSRKDLVRRNQKNGGLIVVGSHVRKTTAQLAELQTSKKPIEFIEFDQHLVVRPESLEKEVLRVAGEAKKAIGQGMTVVIYTKRERIDLGAKNPEDELIITGRIADAVTDIVRKLDIEPGFIIVKGGITSSDVAVKALHADKALILGQAYPGIPVWKLGEGSRFPGIPYIVFPGNVGMEDTLKRIAEELIG